MAASIVACRVSCVDLSDNGSFSADDAEVDCRLRGGRICEGILKDYVQLQPSKLLPMTAAVPCEGLTTDSRRGDDMMMMRGVEGCLAQSTTSWSCLPDSPELPPPPKPATALRLH